MAPLWPSEGPRTKTNLIIHSFLKTSKSTLRSNNSRSEVDLYKYAVLNVLQPLYAFICADFPPYKHAIVLCCSSTSVFVLRDQFVKTPCSRMKIKISLPSFVFPSLSWFLTLLHALLGSPPGLSAARGWRLLSCSMPGEGFEHSFDSFKIIAS